MIKIKPLLYAGGPLAYNEYANAGSPITDYIPPIGSVTFNKAVKWWKLRIFVTAVSGTSPSITFFLNLENFIPQTIALPPITSPTYYEVKQTPDNKLVLTIYNATNEALQQVYLGTFWPATGISLSLNVSGSSPSFSVSAYLVYEDGGEDE